MRMRSSRSAAPRRKMVWARQTATGSPSTVAAGQTVVFDLLSQFRAEYGGATPLGATVTRARIDLGTQAIQTAGFVGCLTAGLIVDQALNAAHPLSEVPDPAVEIHADWMFWRTYFPLPAGDGDNLGITGLTTSAYEIDVRSQRKMEELGESLFFVVRNSTASSHLVQVGASVLLKLP